MALSPKQLLFIEKYFELNFNGTQAAIASGYSPKAAKEQATRLLTKAHVKAEVEKRKAELAKKFEWAREDSIYHLKKIVLESKFAGEKTPAIKILNQMLGYDAPVKIEHSGAISVIKRVLVDPKATA